MKRSFALMVVLTPFVLFGAIQATREYCDKNREKAVTEAVGQLETIAGPTIEAYMSEHGIPSTVTNTVQIEKIINKEIIYSTNYVDNVISNYYLVKNVTNNLYEVTNRTEYIESIISNYYHTIYETTNTVNYTTNYSTFVTAVQEETNTHFIVWSDGLLSIEKNDIEIWREKGYDGMTAAQIREYVASYTDKALESPLADQNSVITTWQSYLDGSNVVFSITNYQSGAYIADDAKLRILELKDDGNYSEVYNTRTEILTHLGKYAETNGYETLIAGKADKAWGKYTSNGTSLDEMGVSNTVYMTAGNTVFAGGTEWERVAVGEGAIWVLVDRGAPVYTDGEEGMFRFQDAGGTNYFGFAKTDSYNIGADTDGITQESGIVTLTYNITSSTKPIILYTSTLTKPIVWEQLNEADGSAISGASHLVQWETNPSEGTQVCYINCADQPQGFFRAEVQVAGSATFITNMPADLQAGIIATNETSKSTSMIKPVVRNGVVYWEVVQ